ncbi:PadR family transcriptional regulator [Candidatus Latescibacterota bacterium]
MTLNEALILSYIKRGIRYGYSILTHVKESGSDEWVDFSRAGLYKTLDKLEKAAFINKKLEQDGGRPPKKVYSITPQGNDALNEYLESGFDFEFQSKYDFDAYLVTAVAASPEASTLAETVQKRLTAVEKQITVLQDDWPEDKDSYPFIVYCLYKKRLESLHCERTWLQWFEDVLKNVSGDILHMNWGEAKR